VCCAKYCSAAQVRTSWLGHGNAGHLNETLELLASYNVSLADMKAILALLRNDRGLWVCSLPCLSPTIAGALLSRAPTTVQARRPSTACLEPRGRFELHHADRVRPAPRRQLGTRLVE
jgi:hypothetical protein